MVNIDSFSWEEFWRKHISGEDRDLVALATFLVLLPEESEKSTAFEMFLHHYFAWCHRSGKASGSLL